MAEQSVHVAGDYLFNRQHCVRHGRLPHLADITAESGRNNKNGIKIFLLRDASFAVEDFDRKRCM